MSTLTERIALEARARYTGQSEFAQAKKDLVGLLKYQAAFNRQSLKLNFAGGTREINRLEVRIKALDGALRSVGETGLADHLTKDVNQVNRVIDGAKKKIGSLNAEMASLNAAQKQRPGADLGGRRDAIGAQLKGYSEVLKQAGAVDAMLRQSSAGARTFAKAEAAVAAESADSSNALSRQAAILAEKKTLFEAITKSAHAFAAAEDKVATSSRNAAAAISGAASGQIKAVDRNGEPLSRTYLTGQRGVTLEETEGKNNKTTRTLREDSLALLKDRLGDIRAGIGRDRREATGDSDLKARLEERRGKAEKLVLDLEKSGRKTSDVYQTTGRLIESLKAEETQLKRRIDATNASLEQRKTFATTALARVASARESGFQEQSRRRVQTAEGSREFITLSKERASKGVITREQIQAVIDYDHALNPINGKLTTLDKGFQRTAQSLRYTSKNFIDNTQNLAAWAASVALYAGTFAAIRGTAAAVVDLQRKAAVLGAVFRGEAGEVERLKGEVLELAVAYGRSGSEALDAATRFARLGLTRRQVLETTAVSLKAANVAEIDAATAAEQLSAIMASYRLEASQLYGVLTRLNNVSNQFNTTNKDLLQGVARVGNLARESGLGLEELVAAVATGTGLTGRSGAEFGNAIKSVIVSLSTPDTQNNLKGLFDFDVHDQTGQIKQMDDLLRDLAVTYQHLTQTEKQELLQIVGKKQQASRLAVILGDYTTMQRNLTAALQDGAATEEENNLIRKTVISQLTSLRSAYERFAASASGAFRDQGAAAGFTAVIKSLTGLLILLEKGAAIFPVVTGMAALFFVRFLAGASAIATANKQGGFLITTLARMRESWKLMVAVISQNERALVKSGAAMSRTAVYLRALSIHGNMAQRAFGRMGRAVLFTIGNLKSFLTTGIGIAAFAFVVNKVASAWEAHNQAVEEARRAALGYSDDLNKMADAAKRAAVLRDTADYIKGVIDSADSGSLSRFVADLNKIGGTSIPSAQRDRLKQLADPATGDRKQLALEVDRVRARAADQALAKSKETADTALQDMTVAEKEISGLMQKLEKAQNSGASDLTKNRLKEDIKEAQSSLEVFRDTYQTAMEEVNKNKQILLEIRVDTKTLEDTRSAIEQQAGAMAEALTGDDAFGKVVAENLKRVFQIAGQEGFLADDQGRFAKSIAAKQGQVPPYSAQAAEVQARLRTLARQAANQKAVSEAAESLRRSFFKEEGAMNFEDARQKLLDLNPKALEDEYGNPFRRGGKLSPFRNRGESTSPLEQLRDQANAEAAAAEKQAASVRNENAGLLDAAARREQLVNAISDEQKAREATRLEQERGNSALREELDRFNALKPRLLEYAERQRQISRVTAEANARMAGFGGGRDQAQQIQNRISSLRQALRESLITQGGLRSSIAMAGNPSEAKQVKLQDKMRLSLQDEMARAGVFANQLEAERLALLTRAATIEVEIRDAKVRQNEETSKALGLASREDQLRAAFLSRFGKRLSENQFQFLDQNTRGAVNSFRPDLAPTSQGSELDRLRREKERLNSNSVSQGALESVDMILRKFQKFSLDAVNAMAGGQSPLLGAANGGSVPPGTTPANITIAPGAVNIDLGPQFAAAFKDLTDMVSSKVDADLATMRAQIGDITSKFRTAAARAGA